MMCCSDSCAAADGEHDDSDGSMGTGDDSHDCCSNATGGATNDKKTSRSQLWSKQEDTTTIADAMICARQAYWGDY